MREISEVYLTKKYVSKEEWHKFIEIISSYQGFLTKWKILIRLEENKFHFYVETRKSLPTTLGSLDAFLIKTTTFSDCFAIAKRSVLSVPVGNNLIDTVEYIQGKHKGKLLYAEINITKLYSEKYLYKCFLYIKKNKITRYLVPFFIPDCFLTCDFGKTSTFLYQSAPKYFDISKTLSLFKEQGNSILAIDSFPYSTDMMYLSQSNYDFFKHSLIVGSSGCGKSKFISSMIYQVYQDKTLSDKYQFVVLDPHASLENDIGGIGKVIDFLEEENSMALFSNQSNDLISATELYLDLFKSLLEDNYNSKVERVLRHSIYLLLSLKMFGFVNLKKLLLDLEFRSALIKDSLNVPFSIKSFFLTDFNEIKTKSYTEAISPIIAFLDEMEMVPVLRQEEVLSSLDSLLTKNFLTIFSLNRTKLGDRVTKTVAGLIMQQILTYVQSKAISKHIIFIVDEVAVVENPILKRFLSEARKYNLSLILASQYFKQISSSLQQAIFANVLNYYLFRVSKMDAAMFVENLDMKVPLAETPAQKVKILTELSQREVVARITYKDKLYPAFKGKTTEFVPCPRIKKEKTLEDSDKKVPNIIKKVFKLTKGINLHNILVINSSSRRVVK